MTIKAILWVYDKKKDGSCNIKLYINYDSKKKYIKTPFFVMPEQFNKKKGEVKNVHPNYKIINSKLSGLKFDIEKRLIAGESLSNFKKGRGVSFVNYLSHYIKLIKEGKTHLKSSSYKNYQSLLTRINQFKIQKGIKDLSFDEIDLSFYHEFKFFMLDGKCNLPGFGKHVKIIKSIMKKAEGEGLHKNKAYENQLFKRYRGSLSKKLFLAENEIEMLEKVNLSGNEGLDFERDRFLISYYLLMRYDDSRNIKKEMFFYSGEKLMIRYEQKKTGTVCIIPISEKAKQLLEKRNYDFSAGDNPQANRNIKIIAATARIDNEVKQGTKSGPKWKFITTHTARRSAATNLALQNVSIKIIADLGGWSDIDTLRTYLRSSGLDTAIAAKDLDFFT